MPAKVYELTQFSQANNELSVPDPNGIKSSPAGVKFTGENAGEILAGITQIGTWTYREGERTSYATVFGQYLPHGKSMEVEVVNARTPEATRARLHSMFNRTFIKHSQVA